MTCRIGMATDVSARVKQLKNEGTVPQTAAYQTLASKLTFEEANNKEKTLRKACGPRCQGHPGGGPKPGRVWSVYRVDW